jgi:DNA-binding NarL/FixJ family response regulator
VSEAQVIRVAIVEDDGALLKGLRRIIDSSEGFSCAAAFGSAEEALAGLDRQPSDVLLLDIQLPGMPGSEAIRHFRERWPSLKVLMLTVFTDEARVFGSICNGANGYLLKTTPPAQLLEAISAAHEGGSPLSPQVARQIVALFQNGSAAGTGPAVDTAGATVTFPTRRRLRLQRSSGANGSEHQHGAQLHPERLRKAARSF